MTVMVILMLAFINNSNESEVCSFKPKEPESEMQQVNTADEQFKIKFDGYLKFDDSTAPTYMTYMLPKLKYASRGISDKPGMIDLIIEFDCLTLKMTLDERAMMFELAADFVHPLYGYSSCFVKEQGSYRDFKIPSIYYNCRLTKKNEIMHIKIRQLSFAFTD